MGCETHPKLCCVGCVLFQLCAKIFTYTYILSSNEVNTLSVFIWRVITLFFKLILKNIFAWLPPKQLYVCICWNTDIYWSFFQQFSKVWEQIENRTVLTHCHINCNNWLDYFCMKMIYWLILLGDVFTLPTVIQISMLKNCTSEVVPQSLSRFRNTQTQSTERHTHTSTHTHLEDSCQLQWCQSVRATWTHVAGNLCLCNRVNVSIVYVA